ncbi:VirB3 family type IV secretion system protein [Pseudomonas fluorescens]|uniref:VirB3 family type IV secretion system protein n=1 Tax=Pseudomonas fluorescens TaxID=294 RepID=UPI0009B61900|nr:VirB3 family type IV secretion system protein [Pseudomonas fluorescens]
MSSKKEKLIFESYNAMSRPAMYWGIPIMPMLGLLMGAVLSFIVGMATLSWVWGLVFAFPFVVGLLALRLITSVDDRYFRRVRFALRRLLLNLKHGKRLLLTSFNPKWSQYYGRRFAEKRYLSGRVRAANEIPRSRKHGNSAG